MAYDRYDSRGGPRERWRSDDRFDRERGSRDRDDRGFFERAGDEIASWFGDDDAEQRRRQDVRMGGRDGDYGRDPRGERGGWGDREPGRERSSMSGWGGLDRDRSPDRDRDRDRSRRSEDDRSGYVTSRGYRGTSGGGGGFSPWGGGERHDPDQWQERGYRPMTGDYGRNQFEGHEHSSRMRRFDEPRDRDQYRQTSFAGSTESHDPHYRQWRDRQISELDRDYDDYRREHQSKFENDFGSWRERRVQKRGLLGQIREHMEVVGSDGEHVGTVDRTAGDRLILTKSDEDSGGVHHSLSCTDVDRIEGDKVILDTSAEQAKQRWRDDNRDRALFEREDQGEAGPGILDRSFSGTYR